VFPVEQSMRYPSQIYDACFWSLLLVWVLYIFVGNYVAYLYSETPGGIQGNILQNLPSESLAACSIRVLMSLVNNLA
jgi:hypothetical protein